MRVYLACEGVENGKTWEGKGERTASPSQRQLAQRNPLGSG